MGGIDGNPLSTGLVHHKTPPVWGSMHTVGSMHTESLEFLLISCPAVPLVLGHPWLDTHNPTIDWVAGEILK